MRNGVRWCFDGLRECASSNEWTHGTGYRLFSPLRGTNVNGTNP
jgi:hypothetical protein